MNKHLCKHCNKSKGDHKADTLNCPVKTLGRTSSRFSPNYSLTQVFEELLFYCTPVGDLYHATSDGKKTCCGKKCNNIRSRIKSDSNGIHEEWENFDTKQPYWVLMPTAEYCKSCMNSIKEPEQFIL